LSKSRTTGGRRFPRGLPAAVALAAVVALAGFALLRSGLADPRPTILFLDRSGRFLGEVGDREAELGFWPVRRLPERVVAATVAVEDRRFRLHPGVDPIAIARAAAQRLARGGGSGASTLAMQVARLQHPGPRTLLRKAGEALAALALTARHGRDGVLAQYLRLAPYGNRIHGIAYAARRYLDKPVDDLSWAEVAFLTALPQAPGRMNPYLPRGRVRAIARGRRILSLLRARGRLSAAEHELAQRQIGAIAVPALPRRPEETLHALLRLARRFDDPGERRALPDPPVVRTTLDPDLQAEVSWMTFDAVRSWKGAGAGNAAAVVLDRGTGRVLAWAGSAGYFDAAAAGAIDYTAVPRPAGSTLKPFLYALALDRGLITPATVLDDSGRGPGGVENADLDFLGPLLPRFALANSRNVPAVLLQGRIGLDETGDFLRDLGLHGGERPARAFGAGLALGILPVSLERLVRAYTALAGDGLLREPVWYEGQAAPPPRRVLSEAAARQVTLFLADPLARLPGFPRMGPSEYPFPAAVKTGTSSGCRDAWAVAWSGRAIVGVWVGRPDFRPMKGLSGYGAGAVLAQRILASIHRDQLGGLADVPFPPPRCFRPVRLCALSGGVPGPGCGRLTLEWFPPGGEPTERCSAHAPRTAAPAGTRTGAGPRHVRITAPEHGSSLLIDPDLPRDRATIALQAVADPAATQVVWYVDGRPFQLAEAPFTVRWRLRPGSHTFQARLPDDDTASSPVRITVH
jgi:penicillin-binding protein 1C